MFIITCYHIDSHKRWNRHIDKFFHNCLRCTRHRGHSSFLRTFFWNRECKMKSTKWKTKKKISQMKSYVWYIVVMEQWFFWWQQKKNAGGCMEENTKNQIYVIGHKNPDTDSICSAIAYAYFKNQTDDG